MCSEARGWARKDQRLSLSPRTLRRSSAERRTSRDIPGATSSAVEERARASASLSRGTVAAPPRPAPALPGTSASGRRSAESTSSTPSPAAAWAFRTPPAGSPALRPLSGRRSRETTTSSSASSPRTAVPGWIGPGSRASSGSRPGFAGAAVPFPPDRDAVSVRSTGSRVPGLTVSSLTATASLGPCFSLSCEVSSGRPFPAERLLPGKRNLLFSTALDSSVKSSSGPRERKSASPPVPCSTTPAVLSAERASSTPSFPDTHPFRPGLPPRRTVFHNLPASAARSETVSASSASARAVGEGPSGISELGGGVAAGTAVP